MAVGGSSSGRRGEGESPSTVALKPPKTTHIRNRPGTCDPLRPFSAMIILRTKWRVAAALPYISEDPTISSGDRGEMQDAVGSFLIGVPIGSNIDG
ncbi:uncharacterized protein LOC142591114 isoform X2 [Dermacentor variabilis]|uniref:uncharacterized protein LOC142591114 isoform X2 n=1 Tax=Dermacentor variabilis TaxID=34621 RepID=UPI003F5C6D44